MPVKDSYTSSVSSVTIDFGGDTWHSMSFTATSNYLAGSIKNRVWRIGVVDPGNVTVSIRKADPVTQLPIGEDLCSAVVVGTTFPSTTVDVTLTTALLITFPTPVVIESGEIYAMIYRSAVAAYMRTTRNSATSNPYADGRNGESTDAGVTWTGTYGQYADSQFAVYSATTTITASGTSESKSGAAGTATGGTTTLTGGRKIRLVPFIYSASVAYVVELGNKYMRFLYDNTVLTTDGNAPLSNHSTDYWIETPYLTADLPQLQLGPDTQIGDVMWITHPSYASRKLTRTSATTFSLDVIPFKNGPFLLRNDLIDPDVTDTAFMVASDNEVGDVGTLTCQEGVNYQLTVNVSPSPAAWSIGATLTGASSGTTCTVVSVKSPTSYVVTEPSGDFTDSETISDGTNSVDCADDYPVVELNPIDFFQAGHVGALFQLTHPKGTLNISGSKTGTDTGYIGEELGTELIGNYTFKVSGAKIGPFVLFLGTVKLQKSNNGFITSTDVKTYTNKYGTFKGTELEEDWYYRINITSHTGGKVTARLTANTNTVSGKMTGSNTGVIGYPIYLKGTYVCNTKGNWEGTFVLERNENGAGWEPYRTCISIIVSGAGGNLQYAGVEIAANVQFRLNMVVHVKGTIHADLTSSENIGTGIVQITALNSPSEAAMIVITKLASTEPTRRWAEGAWSEIQNYPASVTFFEGRCVYGGMSRIPIQITSDYDIDAENYTPKRLKVWPSYSDDFQNFELGLKAADSFEVPVSTANEIMWLKALEALVAGTSGDEWRIGTNRMEQLLSPTNFTARQQTTYGSRNIQATKANDKILFVDFVGRKVQELTYDGDKYVAEDLTSLAEHITLSGIVWTAYQKNPDSILWCGLNDGTLKGLVYNRKQNVIAWFPCPIEGYAQSGCVTPGATEDNVTLAIQRTINDVDKIYIEKFALRNFGTLIEDAFFVDCGYTYDDVATNTITLPVDGDDVCILEGETVVALASGVVLTEGDVVTDLGNGVVYEDLVVTNGIITFPTGITVTKAQVGLAYRSKLMPMRIVINTPQGSSQGLITRVPIMSISFLNSMGVQYGAKDAELYDINWDDPHWENSEDSITGLFTGEVTVSVNGGFSVSNPIIISTDSPLPCVVRSIMPRLEVSGS